tara:strand:- start:260 stop:400 length:141 start_codon:yes stop_codon:yes gene_type:complete
VPREILDPTKKLSDFLILIERLPLLWKFSYAFSSVIIEKKLQIQIF